MRKRLYFRRAGYTHVLTNALVHYLIEPIRHWRYVRSLSAIPEELLTDVLKDEELCQKISENRKLRRTVSNIYR